MKLKKHLLLLSFCFQILFAQEQDPINTDRPDQSDGTYILPLKNFQIENGFCFSQNSVVNNLMLRKGITHGTEIRFLCDAGNIDQSNGFLPLGLGMKQRIIKPENTKRIPAITLSGYYYFGKLAGKNFVSEKNSYNLIIAFQNDFSENFSLGYNICSNDIKGRLNLTASACYSPLKRIILFLEYFAFFERNKSGLNNTDLGILFLLKNNFQLDLAAGFPLANTQITPYVTTGFSWRINW